MPSSSKAPTLNEMLAGATSRQPWFPEDTKSGARFERLVIDDGVYVLKYQDARDDWLMRATGDTGERYVRLWESGLLERMPAAIDHAVVGAEFDAGVGRILLRDVSGQLRVSGTPFTVTEHGRFVDHMAQMHATWWGWRDDVGLTALAARYRLFSPAVARSEAAIGSAAVVPRVMAEGWVRLPEVAPALAAVVFPLLEDPSPLVAALASVPHTLVHGDWKSANIGSHPDGRTVLLDFGELPGEATPIADLAWYLALNAGLLPESNDLSVARFRAALEQHGVDTTGWWDEAVALEWLGAMVQFGWEKALGGEGPELAWWQERALQGARLL